MPFDPSALLTQLDEPQLEALVDTMVLAADADGELAPEERETLATNIANLASGSPYADRLSGSALHARVNASLQRIGEGGREPLIDEVKQKLASGDARRAALGLAIVVTAADGIVRTSERELIMELAEALEIDPDEAADLVRDITRG
ncbi:MAG: tellurite resistance TerB family protein [Myxococcales bacterium]|nr:tellurite resistance TerB family protein [Myxococcales bacterium]